VQKSAREFLRQELARAFPSARVRFLPPSDAARHIVARVEAGKKRVLFAKARIDPSESVKDEVAAIRAAKFSAIAIAEERWFASEAVAGKAAKTWSHDQVRAIGTMLAKLHRSRVPKGMRALPGGATIKSSINEGTHALDFLSAKKIVAPKEVKLLRAALAERAARVLELADLIQAPPALCHGDVRAPNVLFAGETPALVDFEHAGRADAAIELARTAAYERLSRHQRFVLADAYAEARRDDDATIDRAIAALPAIELVLALQAARWLAAIGKLSPAKTKERKEMLEQRIADLIQRPVSLRLTTK
jgi:Ser/Thr protein kinase RdoA (MazF antagonist)